MDLMNYDYYGNYEKSENTFSYSIQEIHKKQREKESRRIKIYENISEKCFKKIKETANKEETYCFFRLPEYIAGYPIYNMTECTMFLLNLLHEKGFKARYCDSFFIFISWNLPKPNLRLIENKQEKVIEEKSPGIIKDLNLKYKPIENYRSFENFIPKKRFS